MESTATAVTPTAPAGGVTDISPAPRFRRIDVARTDISQQLLTIIHNRVFDLTAFVRVHPGGESVLHQYAGRDATAAFEAVGHSTSARKLLERLCIGQVTEEDRVDVF